MIDKILEILQEGGAVAFEPIGSELLRVSVCDGEREPMVWEIPLFPETRDPPVGVWIRSALIAAMEDIKHRR